MPNLASIVEGHADDRVALLAGETSVTYGDLRARAGAVRAALADRGIAPGDRVALVAGTEADFVVAYLGVLGVGAVLVPLNPTSPPPELTREVVVTRPRLVLLGGLGAASWAAVERAETPSVEDVVAVADLEAEGAAGPPPAVVERAPTDLATLLFTAGTAGAPRAAMLTHGNLLANLEQLDTHPARSLRPDDVGLGVLPLFHIYGLNVALGATLAAGASLVLLPRFEAVSALAALRRHGVTVVSGAPPLWRAWADLPGVGPDDVASVRLAASGASALDIETAHDVEARLGLRIVEGYGLTEAAPVVTTAAGVDAPFGSVGVPVPGVELRLVGDDGDDALVGDPGEVWVQGPNVFPGYWEDAEATARALTPDGWLRTGDIGVLDEGGYLFLVDRAKDTIIVSGFNVWPAEVEEVLAEHPAVEESAVVGVPDARTGEAVRAYVVLRPGVSATEDDLARYTRSRLARYKCPTTVVFLDQLPRNLGGKLLRRALRDPAA